MSLCPHRFLPDNHASDRPEIQQVDSGIRTRLCAVLRKHFDREPAPNVVVSRIGGANINSKNYRVGDFFVKQLGEGSPQSVVAQWPGIATLLAARGVPVVQFIPNAEGNYFTWSDGIENCGTNACFTVQPFQEGDFCAGTINEIGQVLNVIPLLERALAEAKGVENLGVLYHGWSPTHAIECARKILLSKTVRTPFEESVFLSLATLRDRINTSTPHVVSASTRVQHLDLHPHNLLFQSGQLVAVVDFDLFVWAPKGIGESFGIYKLLRKGISLRRCSVEDGRSLLRSTHCTSARASTEVLRRLTIILSLYFERGDSSWNRDFEKHSQALAEIDSLFSD